jgi:acyl-CoA hydrolase
MRHGRHVVVTVAVDGMVFHRPVKTGSVLQLDAQVAAVGRTSIDVVVEVSHEDPIRGTLELVNTAHMVYVALGDDHRPTPVPPLLPTTAQEIERHRMVMERKRRRQEP